ncbi:glutamate-5-semialdehyde dehydrogenase [Dimargaris cristalligena]|uniref:glutamate-5-semialdehyde dehydrogenase n=1 Tax=Dimargaris cristalligena TaxID=215637 RepID=A0A4V1J4W7_9FUNG|nr:glutamate-5-semialdehyde dehydrogenase [Dimargaris cristalligena]RKP36999.1 glutamate-5-semialdehyde dehydrogenase [Dimargaris cristalligena]|eukprot:RKP36999.1 glutamate-5-semialdehyde dehydrogenase [Dimargaris cristalligena]
MALTIPEVAANARTAANQLQNVTSTQKSQVLAHIRRELEAHKEEIFAANAQDLQLAQEEVAKGRLSASLFKRLDIKGDNEEKFNTLLQGVTDVDNLPDPIGQVTRATELDQGLDLYRVTAPVGVILVIFEARPEVVVNISCLSIKSSNAAILKGGKEAYHTLAVLTRVMQSAIEGVVQDIPFPKDAIQLVSTREHIDELLQQDRYIDMVIPRGSNQLVRHIQNNTRIPVLGHADGLCSIYLDDTADVNKAPGLVVDSKTNYPAACNSAETLLVHRSLLGSDLLTKTIKSLFDHGVSLRCDPPTLQFIENSPVLGSASYKKDQQYSASTDEDYDTEFLDLCMAVKVVDSVEEAITHINTHGSKHTDCIVTETPAHAEKFMNMVDAAGVYYNASTRFADGFRYGFGTEIGVSTNKTHARGPVGLEGLTIYKYRLYGQGHKAGDFGVGANKKAYLHNDIGVDSVKNKFVR